MCAPSPAETISATTFACSEWKLPEPPATVKTKTRNKPRHEKNRRCGGQPGQPPARAGDSGAALRDRGIRNRLRRAGRIAERKTRSGAAGHFAAGNGRRRSVAPDSRRRAVTDVAGDCAHRPRDERGPRKIYPGGL